MKRITLSKTEFHFLENYLSANLLENNIQISLTIYQKDEILDKLGVLLQKLGFNEEYETNKQGKIIEGLIDKINDL